ARDGGRGDLDHPAGRLDPRSGGDRRRRRRGRDDGVHRPAPLPPLSFLRLGGDPPSPWEEPYGFSRVVQAGGVVVVGGTTSVDADGVVIGATPYDQAVEILRKLPGELARVRASLADVVQTRAYVTDISPADDVG